MVDLYLALLDLYRKCYNLIQHLEAFLMEVKLLWRYTTFRSLSHLWKLKFSSFLELFVNAILWLLSCVQLFVTPWTAVCQASLSFPISYNLLKLMSIESVMSSNHLWKTSLWRKRPVNCSNIWDVLLVLSVQRCIFQSDGLFTTVQLFTNIFVEYLLCAEYICLNVPHSLLLLCIAFTSLQIWNVFSMTNLISNNLQDYFQSVALPWWMTRPWLSKTISPIQRHFGASPKSLASLNYVHIFTILHLVISSVARIQYW